MSSGQRILAGVALVALVLGSAGAARAAPTAADRETARTLMDQGRDLRDKGDLKEALKRFQAADEIMHVPTTSLEVVRTEVALGLLVEARDTVAALRQIPAKRESQLFKDARVKAEEIDASLNGRVPSVTIVLKGAPPGPGAEVAIDGVAVPSATLGLPRSVDPGHHVVTARSASAEGKQEIDLREGEQKPVEVTMVATGAVLAEPVVAPVPVEAPTPAKKSHSPTALTVAGIGLAGAGVIAGSITGILSLSKKSTLVSQCPNHVCGPASYSTLDSANLLATISDVSFAAAGAGAVVAVVSLVVGHGGGPTSPPPSSGLTVTPWFAGDSMGVRGSF